MRKSQVEDQKSGYSSDVYMKREAAGDEKKAKWLEENLALTPKTIEQMKKWAAANGSEVLSCNITINGYDSMTQETVVRDIVDPGTEKAKKRQEERIKKIKEEKKAVAEKQKTFKSERAVQVDISKEAMDKYRAHIPVADHIIKAGAVFRSRFVL